MLFCVSGFFLYKSRTLSESHVDSPLTRNRLELDMLTLSIISVHNVRSNPPSNTQASCFDMRRFDAALFIVL